MNTLGHVMILASAGSGKTYALTNRFVRLLALGVPPDRIVALTFTRKAAGEFFDEILTKLARAATDEAYAQRLATAIEVKPPAPASRLFLSLLRGVTDAMHRLRLGTLDGFFASIARNFPLELGLSGDFEVLEEHAARVQRARVLRQLFQRTGRLESEQREFIEAFKRATFGVEEKRLGAQLDSFLDQHQEVFLGAPQRSLWGDPRQIWPHGNAWLEPTTNVATAAQVLRAWADQARLADRHRVRWADFLDDCAAWTPGTVPSPPLAYVLTKALAAWSDVTAGRAVLEFDRKRQELPPDACAALAVLTRHVVGGELARRLEMTRGIHAVLAAFEAVYHANVRRAGKLTFGDVQRLLQPADGAPVLSARRERAAEATEPAGAVEGESPDRLTIDYRLDAKFDHWLLDEFQDTSFGQWSVLRNLIDEVVQDPAGQRSFFYVGDVKQAIFSWRDGDPRLFREIFDYYNAMRPGAIAEQHLVTSWRSGPAIIAAVNRVFGDAAVLRELFAGAAADTWVREWRAHETAHPTLSGHVALLHGTDEGERFAATLGLLQEITPLARGLSCAVLVRDNRTAAALADYLRRNGAVRAVAESDLHVCTDNPVGAALLALVHVAAHPGDELAWQHVQMSPLGRILAAAQLSNRDAVTRRLLAQIHATGFEATLTAWGRALEETLAEDDGFSRMRVRQLTAAAGRFDETGSRDVAEFVQFMDRHTVRDVDTADAVRVMTIHKSKGLGFDVVIAPDLEGQKLDGRREGLAVQRASDRTVEWVFDLPSRLFHDSDDVLARYVRSAEASACYEAISLLYVAMTRAKRALYLIVKPPGTSTSRNYPRLLAETLGETGQEVRVGFHTFRGAYSEGDPTWHVALTTPAAEQAPVSLPLPVSDVAAQRGRPRLPARLPSGTKRLELRGAQLFSPRRAESAEFGTAVHQLLAEVEWGGPAMAELLRATWGSGRAAPAVVDEAFACLTAPALTHVWEAVGEMEVWRERAFEVVLEGAWISGVFDRVLVRRREGRPTQATVFDFKTDDVRSLAEARRMAQRHDAQLQVYRRVVALLTGLRLADVNAEVVFTQAQLSVPLGQ